MKVTTINGTENLILKTQDITAELKAIKMFLKERFYLIKKYFTNW